MQAGSQALRCRPSGDGAATAQAVGPVLCQPATALPESVSSPSLTSPPWPCHAAYTGGPLLQPSRTRARPGTFGPHQPGPPGHKASCWPRPPWHTSLSPNSTKLSYQSCPHPNCCLPGWFPLPHQRLGHPTLASGPMQHPTAVTCSGHCCEPDG